MRKFLLVMIAALTLGAGAAQAQSYSHEAPSNHPATGPSANWLEGGGG